MVPGPASSSSSIDIHNSWYTQKSNFTVFNKRSKISEKENEVKLNKTETLVSIVIKYLKKQNYFLYLAISIYITRLEILHRTYFLIFLNYRTNIRFHNQALREKVL